jgi:hypothetical protein
MFGDLLIVFGELGAPHDPLKDDGSFVSWF